MNSHVLPSIGLAKKLIQGFPWKNPNELLVQPNVNRFTLVEIELVVFTLPLFVVVELCLTLL